MKSKCLTKEQVQVYERMGYLVIRDVFSGEEVEKRSSQTSDMKFEPDSSCLEDTELASVASLPLIVERAEALLGSPVVLSKWNAYFKKPGVGGTALNPGEWGGDYESLHPRAHMDYKTYHPPDSSLHWIFSIVRWWTWTKSSY